MPKFEENQQNTQSAEQQADQAPFAGMSRDAAAKEFAEMIERYGNIDFELALRDLRTEIAKTDPLLLLATFVAYGLMKPPGVDPETSPYSSLLQHHIELLQALTLMGPGFGGLNTPPIEGRLSDLLRQVSMSAMLRRFSLPTSASPEGKEIRLFLQEVMRGHTQAVRNWAYPQQVVRILVDLFAPLEADIERTLGIQVKHLVHMFIAIEEECTRRVNAHNDRLRPMLQSKSVHEAFTAYYREMPNLAPLDLEAVQEFEKRGMDIKAVQAALFCHSHLLLVNAFTIMDIVEKLFDAIVRYSPYQTLSRAAISNSHRNFAELSSRNGAMIESEIVDIFHPHSEIIVRDFIAESHFEKAHEVAPRLKVVIVCHRHFAAL